jgi:hypothetical protein
VSQIALDLLAIDRALDREIDRLAAVFMGGLNADVNRTWMRAIISAIDRLDRKGIALSDSTRNANLARSADSTVRSGLATSGYREHVQRTFDQFTEVVKLSARALRKGGIDATLQPFDTNMLGTYRGLKLLEFDHLADRFAGQVSTAIGRAVVAGQSVTELVVEVQEILQTFAFEARTHFETAASEFAQTMTLLRGGNDQARVYLYSGPIDMRIRRFCLEHVGKVLTRPTIDRLDNKQLPNSFLTRGGYNCRHQWRDVTAIPELARLADSNTIVNDHIKAQVEAMRGYLRVAGRQRGVRTA